MAQVNGVAWLTFASMLNVSVPSHTPSHEPSASLVFVVQLLRRTVSHRFSGRRPQCWIN